MRTRSSSSRRGSRVSQRHGRNNRLMSVRQRDDLAVRRRRALTVVQCAAVMMMRRRVRQLAVDAVVGRRLRYVHRTEPVFQVTATAHLLRHRHQRCAVYKNSLLVHGDPEAGLDNHVFNSVWKFDKHKLAPYGTDGRLFTTDVSATSKVTWHKN